MSEDPLLYAGALSTLAKEKNPIQLISGDVTRMIKIIKNFRQNMRRSQERIEQLEQQIDVIETYLENAVPVTTGLKLDKTR